MFKTRLAPAAAFACALLVSGHCEASEPGATGPRYTAAQLQASERIDALHVDAKELAMAGDFKRALTKWRKGLSIAESAFGEGPYVDLMLTSIGLAQANLGQFEQSEASYLRALAMRERLKTKEDEESATLYLNTGLLYANTGRPLQAEPFLRRALEVMTLYPPKDEGRLAFTIETLANVLRRNGKDAEAEALARGPGGPRLVVRPPSARP